jgi:polyisoprenoid-binding protein YceI
MKFSFALCLALLAPIAAHAEVLKVDTGSSKAEWEGRKLVGAHHGELKFKSGEFKVEKGQLTGGAVEIDMTSLNDIDLTDQEMNTKLINHLKSDDFFSIAKHPISSLKVTKVAKGKDGKFSVTGDLTIKGITHPVTFPADIEVGKDGLKATGEMTVDRTAYDIKFRSKKFFADIGDKVIYDEFKVKVNLVAHK